MLTPIALFAGNILEDTIEDRCRAEYPLVALSRCCRSQAVTISAKQQQQQGIRPFTYRVFMDHSPEENISLFGISVYNENGLIILKHPRKEKDTEGM